MSIKNPFESRPRKVCLLGLGPSLNEYVSENSKKKKPFHTDEVWAINTAHRSFKADIIWAMDDLAHIESEYPDWGNELKLTQLPIVTCRAHPDYPNAFPYPIDDVIKSVQDDYFTTTVAYAIAYAIHIKVEELFIFGCDFHYPNAAITESGQGCVSYLLGMAKAMGMNYVIPQSSTLMDANLTYPVKVDGGAIKPKRLLYGYDYNPQISKRAVQRGATNDPLQKALAGAAYRPTNPEDPDCLKAIEKAGGKQILQPLPGAQPIIEAR